MNRSHLIIGMGIWTALIIWPTGTARAQGSQASASWWEDRQELLRADEMSRMQLRMFEDFVSCIVDRDIDGSITYLRLPYDERDDWAMENLMGGRIHNCLSQGEIRFSSSRFVRQLLREVVRRGVISPASTLEAPRNPLEALAFCVLDQTDEASEALMESADASALEREAFDRIFASSDCTSHLEGYQIPPSQLKSALLVVAYSRGRGNPAGTQDSDHANR